MTLVWQSCHCIQRKQYRINHCLLDIPKQRLCPLMYDSAADYISLMLREAATRVTSVNAQRNSCSSGLGMSAQSIQLLCAQDLLSGFQETQVAYLDLSMYPTAALQNAGADSCVAGQLKLMPGMLGTPSQVLAIAFLIHYNLLQHGHFVWQFRIHLSAPCKDVSDACTSHKVPHMFR